MIRIIYGYEVGEEICTEILDSHTIVTAIYFLTKPRKYMKIVLISGENPVDT